MATYIFPANQVGTVLLVESHTPRAKTKTKQTIKKERKENIKKKERKKKILVIFNLDFADKITLKTMLRRRGVGGE